MRKPQNKPQMTWEPRQQVSFKMYQSRSIGPSEDDLDEILHRKFKRMTGDKYVQRDG